MATSPRASRPPSGPSTRSSSRSGTWSSGTGASASMNVTPPSENSLWCRPRLTTTTSPGPERPRLVLDRHLDLAVEDDHHLLGVARALCQRHLLAGVVATRQSSTCSPPIACRRTPSWISKRLAPVPGAGTAARGVRHRRRGTRRRRSTRPSSPTAARRRRRACRRGAARASPAIASSTRSGVAGISVTHTPTAS